jgi:molybdopterin synthase sulfur carrier subunit
MIKIRFSSALKGITNTNEKILEIDNTTLKSVLDKLIEEFGDDFGRRILEKGEIRRFVNVYINGEDVRYLKGINSDVGNNDEISILPAVSGGYSPK